MNSKTALLSLSPGLLGALWPKDKVLMGIGTCKTLSNLLPENVYGVVLRLKDQDKLAGVWDDLESRRVVPSLQRFTAAPGFKLIIETSLYVTTWSGVCGKMFEKTFGQAGWAHDAHQIDHFSTRHCFDHALRIQRAFCNVMNGINTALAQGFLRSLVSLEVGVECDPMAIHATIKASLSTLQSVELNKDFALSATEIMQFGITLKNSPVLREFVLYEVLPESDEAKQAVTQCVINLVSSCQSLEKIVLCQIPFDDASAAVIGPVLENSPQLLDLDIPGACLSNKGWTAIFRAIHRFKAFDFFPDSKTTFQNFIELLFSGAAKNLKSLQIMIDKSEQDPDGSLELKLRQKCEELQIALEFEVF